MKYLKFLLVALVCLLLVSGCQNHSHQSQKVDQLDIGKIYHFGGEFKLIDQRRFVRIINQSHFESQEKLEEYRVENEDFTFYPTVYFAEGTYEKVGEEYQLTVQKRVRIEFKNVSNIKKKVISRQEIDSTPAKNYICLIKEDGYYTENGKVPLKTSEQEIPESIDEFLAQYKYEPEELE